MMGFRKLKFMFWLSQQKALSTGYLFMGTKTKVAGVGSSIVKREGICQGGNQVDVSLGNMTDIILTTPTYPSLAVYLTGVM